MQQEQIENKQEHTERNQIRPIFTNPYQYNINIGYKVFSKDNLNSYEKLNIGLFYVSSSSLDPNINYLFN